MKFDDTAIGGRIIETVTSGLYDGNLNCLREYVQNSIDAGATSIKIYFENGHKDLIIKDDGSGMTKEKLRESLSMGKSYKEEPLVGWRGLGIWSGVPACFRIVIMTKKKNDKKYRIEVDCNKLRAGWESGKLALEILTEATGEIEELELGKDESFEDLHFTMVRLESILRTQEGIFTDERILNYLPRVVPAPFDEDRFPIATKIDTWLKANNVEIPHFEITFDNRRIFRPPYSADIFFPEPIFKEFTVRDEAVAFGWFLASRENAKLKEPNNGICFKKKGFTIGDKNLVIGQFPGAYNEWQYGEIHIVSRKLKENAGRNNFEVNNDVIDPFLDDVKELIGNLQEMSRYQSSTVVSKRVDQVEKLLEKGNFNSAKKKIDGIKKTLQTVRSYPKAPALKKMKPIIDNESGKGRVKVAELDSYVKKTKPVEDMVKVRKQLLEDSLRSLPKPLRDYLQKFSGKGLTSPEINATEVIATLLKGKTGLDENEISVLSKRAYGWGDVTPYREDPLLTITGGLDNKRNKFRNRVFGVLIFAIHDMFVNTCKHEKGKGPFKWFEELKEEEKLEIIKGMYESIGLIYRIAEKSKKTELQRILQN